MQTLGLGGESKRFDGWLKSLLWPSVENAWDVDYLGQQGMWICTVVAIVVAVTSLASGNVIAISMGMLISLFYFLGGLGVRQGSWPAAAIILLIFVLGTLIRVAYHELPNVFRILASFVPLSNLRATFLASLRKPVAEGEDRPTRFKEAWSDKVIDQMPARLWPVLETPFIVLSVCMLLLVLVMLAAAIASLMGLRRHVRPRKGPNLLPFCPSPSLTNPTPPPIIQIVPADVSVRVFSCLCPIRRGAP